jgi:phage tail protein X
VSGHIAHRTKAGDRWDQLALRYYGEPLLLGPLLRANPAHAAKTVLDGNLTIRVPIVTRAELAPDPDPVVEWR